MPTFISVFLLICLAHDLDSFRVVELVPKSIRPHNHKVMVIDLKTCDFWFVDDDAVLGLLRLKIAKSSSSGQSAGEHSKRPRDGVIESIGHFSDGSSLVDLSSCLNDALLFIGIGRLVVLGHLIALVELVAGQNSPRISQIRSVTEVVVDEQNECATA